MLRPLHGLALAGVLGLALATGPVAQAQSSKDPAAAPAGTYKLDPNHTSVIARLGHMNTFSYSTFRFGTTSGTLNWDPAKIENSKVDITIETASIMTPVKDFPAELSGDKFMNSAKFPTARFVSTSIKRTGPTKGEITGQLTFMGVTKPMVIEAELVGAGKGMRAPVVGFTGTAHIKRTDYGFSAGLPAIADQVNFLIDTEFDKVG
jgi:polyisoprenoid-binding protein YceI